MFAQKMVFKLASQDRRWLPLAYRGMTSVVGAFVFSSAAGRWHGGCWLGQNNAGLALPIFECQVFDLLHAGLLDLHADEF